MIIWIILLKFLIYDNFINKIDFLYKHYNIEDIEFIKIIQTKNFF